MKTYISQIKENENVDSFFLVKEKVSGVTKTGSPYLKLKLGDRSGEMEGRIWSSAEAFAGSFQRDDFVRLRGRAVFFQDRLQLNIAQIERIEEDKAILSDFFPSTDKDIEAMSKSLTELGQQVENPYLRRLLALFWEDQEFFEGFRKAPASKQLHHSYLGGLLEHTLSVTQLVQRNAVHYEGVDVGLLMTGAMLHDVGKVYELSYRRSFDYSDQGRLLGHILIGIQKVEEKIRQIPDFPPGLSVIIKHLLLSHHGQYDYGSPKKPMTIEAMMLHHLDDMDAKISGIRQFMKTHVQEGTKWSTYHPLFEQFFYAADKSDDATSEEER